jgi:CRP-like cAMP-binding protein
MNQNNVNAKIYKFKKGHILYKKGDPVLGLSILYLSKGEVEITYKINENKTFRTVISDGNVFGLFEALSSNQTRITNAVILADSEIWLWKKNDFLVNSNIIAELGLKAVFCLSKYLRTINQTIEEIG